MAYITETALGWRPWGLGAEGDHEFSVELELRAQAARLDAIKKTTEEALYWRKIATGAAIAGALFAMVRLSDIYFAVKRRQS